MPENNGLRVRDVGGSGAVRMGVEVAKDWARRRKGWMRKFLFSIAVTIVSCVFFQRYYCRCCFLRWRTRLLVWLKNKR